MKKKISKGLIKNLNQADLKEKFQILDIGSNIGDKSLSISNELAKITDNFKIFSIEPTEYAYNKQIKNINSNPQLSKFIDSSLCLIQSNINYEIKDLYSSWKLDKKSEHQDLMGQKNEIGKNTNRITLDDFCKNKEILNLKAIKIDVDGYEFDVLKSGFNTLKKFKPMILIEYSEYLMSELDQSFTKENFINLLNRLNYKSYDLKGNIVNIKNIKPNNTINLILK